MNFCSQSDPSEFLFEIPLTTHVSGKGTNDNVFFLARASNSCFITIIQAGSAINCLTVVGSTRVIHIVTSAENTF